MKYLEDKKVWIGLLILLMLCYPFFIGQSSYLITIFVMTCIYAISSMALNLLIGYGGQMSVGHAGFLAIGGYSVAILSTKAGIPFILAFPLAGIITAIIGFIIGLPAVRLSGHFLAVATLGFGLSIPHLALNWDSLTNGFSGLSVSRPAFISSDIQYFYFVIAITVIITWILVNILKSRFGRAFVAIRESEVAAQANGINVSFYKALMFVISAFFTGLAGGLYGYWVGFVSPHDFSVVTSFLLLGMIVVGGMASIPGAIIGTIIFMVLPELTRSFIGVTNIVLGIAITLIILFKPTGIISIFNRNLLKKHEKQQYKVVEEERPGGEGSNVNN